ncbi:TlpA family protein disulfide reductase [Pseudaminobacter arsenicus]|uniref:TlpA family protein disulfide reductase n=2 Tax=Borborobacter arsenicus TaxID=1851146 RepID=A0A432V4Q9_9HYPH|nr:TlpA family protein disulfide reductase [Pseudaminobacter arsenicus]
MVVCRHWLKPMAAALLLVSGATAAFSAELARWTGEPKPPLHLESLYHGRVSLDDHKGRAVLVHFFATWCEPCVEEMASLERLAVRRQGDELSILAIDVGEVDARVRNFFKRNPASFPVLLDRDRAVIKAWQVKALPSSFILDSNLVPVLFVERDVDWDDPSVNSALDELIKTLPRDDRRDVDKREADENDKPT